MTTSIDICQSESSPNKRPLHVLLLNGSTRKNGCTYTALCEVAEALNQDGVQTEIFQMGGQGVHDCIACGRCEQLGHCVFDDDIVNQCLAHAQMADGFVFGSPVYYAHPTGQILAVLDRMFYAGKRYFMQKPGAAVVSARRAGTTASLDVLHKYFADARCPWSVLRIGIWYTVRRPMRFAKIWRVCKRCAIWGTIWHGCSNVSASPKNRASIRPPRRMINGPTLFGKTAVSVLCEIF